ncbi:restriction endonuclease subunit S [Helicobacter pylori]
MFEKIIIKPLPYQTAQLPKEKTPTHELPALTAGILNQGLNNFVPKENATILKNVISISANGANTGATFYQPHEFCVLQDAYAIEFIGDKKLNDKEYLFFVCAISKVIYNNSKYEWTNKAGWNKVKNELISLPLKPTAKIQTLEDIDFDFMEKFIAELEQCRLAELQAYLKATGLENTTLSSDEENALNVFNGNNSGGGNTPCGLTWQHFKLGDLFEIYTGRDIIIGQTQQGDIPLVSHQHENNGITKTIKEIHNRTIFNYKQTIALADRGVFLATTQNKDFHIGTRVKALVFKNGEQDKKTRLFFTTCINKNQIMFLDYSSNATNKLPNLTISLPTTQDGGIDFNFMHTLINALMKQIIQGVAQYCGAKIQATKEIISQETPVQKDSLF